MRVIASIFVMMEEATRRHESLQWICPLCTTCLVYTTMADKLWPPFKMLAFSPLVTLVVYCVLYLLICIVYVPLWLLSFLISSFGSFVVLVVMVVLGLQSLGRSIAFPGSTANVQREMSADYFRKLLNKLDNLSQLTATFCGALLAYAGGNLRTSEMGIFQQKAAEMMIVCDVVDRLGGWLSQLHMETKIKEGLTKEQLSSLSQLADACHSLIDHIDKLKTMIASIASGQRVVVAGESQSDTMATLRACQILKSCIDYMRPPKTESEGLFKALNKISQVSKGPSGFELIAFPMMRKQLLHTYHGERISLAGSASNVIDGVIIFATPNNIENSSENQKISTIGTVLFCCPNAGMYESMANSSKDCSWVGYYTRLGLDICVFNYRGFGGSTGVPTPNALKTDTEAVVKYLRDTRGVRKLIIHGESIGGMMACHAARVCGADLLICDRTFCSLDAVAERLLGAWASMGINVVCGWKTDVVTDFLGSKCPRLVLQDPSDEIISHSSSLKCGIAAHLAMKDTKWSKRDLSWHYVFSEYNRDDQVPQFTQTMKKSDAKIDLSHFFSETHLEHFTACVINIGRRADGLLRSTRTKNGLTTKTSGHDLSGNSSVSLNVSHGKSDRNTDEDEETGGEMSPALKYLGSDVQASDGSMKMSRVGFLDKFCGQNVEASNNAMHPLEKYWILLARLNGSCGQLLGQAIATRHCHDSIRSWLCCLLVWEPTAQVDRQLPSKSTTLQTCLRELSELVDLYPESLKEDSAVQFVLHTLRQTEVYLDELASSKSSLITKASGTSTSLESTSLISLHCGHNGWPNFDDLNTMANFIKDIAGIDISTEWYSG